MKYPSQIRIALFSGILFLLTGVQASAQTDAMFTKYMFNSLVFNPAYAGSKEHMSIGLLHRSQWFGVNGSPHTQTFTLHTPFKKHDRLAIGGSLINETVGTTKSTTANLSYAYRIRMGQGNKLKTLSVGLQGGMTNWRADLRNLEIYDGVDEAFGEQAPSYWLPNFGFGLHFYAKNYFVGVSIPNLLEYDLRQKNINTERYARTFRHYYFMAGGAIPFGNDLVFRPIVLVKSAGLFSQFKGEDNPYGNYGSPSELDVDLSILLRKTLWLGVSFRTAIEKFNGTSSFDSVDLWFSYQFKNGLNIGAAYDYTLTEIQQPTKGSFEVMLGYEFDFKSARVYTPRHF